MPSPLLEPLIAVGVPAGAAGLAGILLWLLRRHRPVGAPAPIGWEGAALALGIAGGVILLRGWSGFPPSNVNDWPAFLAILAALVALGAGLPWRVFGPLALVAVAISAPLILSVARRTWGLGESALWLPALGIPWLVLILLSRASAERLPAAILPAWAATVTVSAIVMVQASSASLAMVLGGPAAAAGALAVLRLVCGDSVRPASAAVALALSAPLWWLLAHTLTDNVPVLALVPLAAAPLAAWLAWPLRARPWPAAIVAALAAGGIAALSLLWVRVPPPVAW
jgi:hypothetical protein